jgi:hypothetical protein
MAEGRVPTGASEAALMFGNGGSLAPSRCRSPVRAVLRTIIQTLTSAKKGEFQM